MCIIACKPIGLEMPNTDTITNMWHANPDGAGIMYNKDGKVQIEKGFMKLDDFLSAVERIGREVDLTNTGVVMHFRITTHGGTRPENTHPFPISDKLPILKKLRLTTTLGMAHNGIISNTPRSKDISDTMEYILSQLAPLSRLCPEFLTNEDARLLVKNGIGSSKLAFLTGDGTIHKIGDFVSDDVGRMYSNHTYESWWSSPKYMNYSVWNSKEGKWETSSYSGRPYALPDAKSSKYDWPYDDDELDYWTGDLVSQHYLMPISDVYGSFYTDKDGTMYEDMNYDVYIDPKGRAWTLEIESGLCFLDDTITGVYNSEGMKLRFDIKLAEWMDCYDYDNNTGCYV